MSKRKEIAIESNKSKIYDTHCVRDGWTDKITFGVLPRVLFSILASHYLLFTCF